VIILTSNLGAQHLLKLAAASGSKEEKDKAGLKKLNSQIRAQVMQTVRDHFRPEFLNRLDDIVIFQSMHYSQISKVSGECSWSL
jgi:ATP-dependent Clp protease ATP-binding subunit ClpA